MGQWKISGWLALLLCSVHAHSAPQTSEKNLMFSAFEQQVWQLVMPGPEVNSDDFSSELLAWQQQPEAEPSPYQALVLMHLCRLAFLHDPDLTTFAEQAKALMQTPIYAQGAATSYYCQQKLAEQAGDFKKATEQAHLAFRSLHQHDSPALIVWLSYDYIETALEAGFYDKAIEAAQRSLHIAQANGLTEWQGETLGRLALVQSAIGNFEQALETNQFALGLISLPYNQLQLSVNRGYILMEAERLEEAQEIYSEIFSTEVKESFPNFYLIAGINLAKIAFELELHPEHEQLTTELLDAAEQLQDGYLLALVQQTRAFSLLTRGELEEAMSFFSRARSWFESHQVSEPLAFLLRNWATVLHSQNLHQEAYLALRDSIELQQSIDLAKRRENALLNNALLTTEQQKRDLLLAQQQQERDQAKLTEQQLRQSLILSILIAILLLGATILIAYYRLRKVNQLLTQKNQLLDYESSHDPLTKVHNRRYFNEFIAPKLNNSADALLVLMDIDHFKQVNDTYGHQAGDEVLRIVSKRLASRLRASDCIIRWGGEEFLLYIDKPENEQQCRAIVQRLLSEIESSPIQLDNTELKVTISIGFSVVRFSSLSELEQHLNQVDTLLYQAKNTGRNRAVGFLPDENKVMILGENNSN